LAKLESLADVNEAQLQAKAGMMGQALPLYQRALQLDDWSGDKAAAAEDWLAYGRLLDAAGFSARVAYACLIKSEKLRPSAAQAVPDSLAATRKLLEKKLGAEAAAIRRDPEPAAQEALALRR
jgi:tetratricopeptide (TPR) repeat protein